MVIEFFPQRPKRVDHAGVTSIYTYTYVSSCFAEITERTGLPEKTLEDSPKP